MFKNKVNCYEFKSHHLLKHIVLQIDIEMLSKKQTTNFTIL